MFGSDLTATAAPGIIAVNVGPATRNSQVVQDHPAVPLQRSQKAGGAPLPAAPRRQATASGLGLNRSPQPTYPWTAVQAASSQMTADRSHARRRIDTQCQPASRSASAGLHVPR